MRFCAKTYESVVMENGIVNASRPRVGKLVSTGAVSNISTGQGKSFLWHLQEDPGDPSSPVYKVNEADYSNTAAYMTEIFSAGWTMRGFRTDNSIPNANAPNLGFKFAEVEDFPATLWDITESMTEVIRTSRNSTVVTVPASRTRTWIEVHFEWLALPIAITAISLALVTWVIFASHRDSIPILRNSNLALLAYQVDGWATGPVIAKGEGALANAAEGVQVILPKESRGLGFARVENA